MAKKEKIELTPEERLGLEERKKAKRKIFGETFLKACALFLSIVFVYSVTYVAFGKGRTVYQSAPITSEMLNNAVSVGGPASTGNQTSSDNNSNAPATDEAAEAAKAINEATAAAVNAGYKWTRNSKYTKNVDVGSATSVLNNVIHTVDSNASVDSVVGGFIGIGEKKADIAKGADAAEAIGYHGSSYKLKATKLEAGDLKNLKVENGTYTFTLENANTPKKDGSNALNRLTDDIVIQDEVAQEIKDQVGSAITVSSLVGTYSNINVKVVIADGKLTEMTYSYDVEVTELGLKVAVVSVKGTGAMHTEATYSDFVY